MSSTNLPFSETKENKAYPQQSSKLHPSKSTNILGISNRRSSNSNMQRRSKKEDITPETLHRNLSSQNHSNGASHASATSNEVFDKLHHSPSRRAVTSVVIDPSPSMHATLQRRHSTIPTSCITSSPIKNFGSPTRSNSHSSNTPSNGEQRKRISSIQKRYILLCCAILLALFGIFVDVNRIMDYAATMGTVTTSKEWIKNFSLGMASKTANGSSISNGIGGVPTGETTERTFSGSAYSGSVNTNVNLVRPNAISLQEEWARVKEMSRERARQRKMRTSPSKNTSFASGSAAALGRDKNSESLAPPTLVLDVPSHRPLNNQMTSDDSNNNTANLMLRRLESAPAICGPQAREASQRHPNNYPASTALNSNSRVVVTGALSQLGMEVIMSLHEQCGVSFIMGLDSAYPNTRHDRIEMMEWRYKHIASRVPGFQKLMIPLFGIHPHPRLGEEVKYEAEGNSFSIMRFNPTHVVHLAGLEEGMDEHTDYGDNEDASPFADGDSDMMRRFEALVSIDQVLTALRFAGDSRPNLVYVSSNEVSERSGVDMMQNSGGVKSAAMASLYGTTSLMKEVLASYYYKHHGVQSVGLRVPMLLGPFSRPGSVVYDLAERTVRHAAGKNVKGVPRYHADRDRYDLSTILKKRAGANEGRLEQVAFASDVAQAIVSALQFRQDDDNGSDGPMIMRLGSKFTTSMRDLAERMEGYLPPYNHWEDQTSSETTSSISSFVSETSRALSVQDADRNRDLLGWSHSTRLHEGTKSILAWHVFKAYPFGLPTTVPSHEIFQQIVADSFSLHDRHAMLQLPCASDCRWPSFCTASAWDDIREVTISLTQSCPYVLYTVDLRPELVKMEKQSTPSQRSGWEEKFCKIAFVSSSSKLAKAMYGNTMNDGTPQTEWNGKQKEGYWFIIVVNGSQYTMNEAERSMPKLAPNIMFNERVEKAMYINHRRVCLTTDQATGVMRHLEMKGRDRTDKKTIVDENKREIYVKLPPRAPRHSIFFTNRYIFADDFDTSNARNLAKFVMTNMGIAETSDIRNQVQFYEQTAHNTRTNTARSANYQEFFQENLFPFDFLRTTWLVHELKTQEGHDLRCEMYQEHSMWGNNGMEDLSIGYVLGSRKVRMQLGKMAAPEYEGPEEWYPLLVPKEPGDEDFNTEGPLYLDYLEEAQKTTKDETGAELYVTFLPQKRE